jgi:NADPH2:quinone reductase
MPAAAVVRLPEAVSFEDAAAAMLKGLTVQFLFRRTVPIGPGDTVLFHAAAGGVGLLACQWARSEGIRLIGTAGGPEKCALALENGAAECIDYHAVPDVAAEVRRLTGGKGVPVVMDAVGRDTFAASMDSLATFGMLVCFGASSGSVPPLDVMDLMRKGSLKLTRPSLFAHIADPAVLRGMAADLFAKMERGEVRARIGQRFPLAEVAEAHRALEARATTGSTVLVP